MVGVGWLQSLRHIVAELFVRLRLFGRQGGGGGGGLTTKAEPPHLAASSSFVLTRPPPLPSAPAFPDFEFKPSDDFLAAMGGGSASFTVANPLDLTLRRCGALMLNVLVVDIVRACGGMTTLWFKFDPAALDARGVSICRLFVDPGAVGGEYGLPGQEQYIALDGRVCGWVINRKQA